MMRGKKEKRAKEKENKDSKKKTVGSKERVERHREGTDSSELCTLTLSKLFKASRHNRMCRVLLHTLSTSQLYLFKMIIAMISRNKLALPFLKYKIFAAKLRCVTVQ